MDKSGKVLSTAEWEQVISDFATSEPLQQRWLAAYPAQALLELALNIIAKERGADFSLKQQLLVFLEENGALLVGKDMSAGLGRVSGVLRTLLAAPGSSSPVSQTVLSQVISLAAVLAVQTESQEAAPGQLEALVDLLLNVVSRVNSLPDRQVRGAACEALRVLERAVPCLLHSALGHLLAFCQAERTHVAQSYILLFLTALVHAAVHLFQQGGGVRNSDKAKRGRLLALSEQVTSWVPSYFRFTDQGGQKPARETPLVRRSSSSGSALLSSVAPLTPYALPPFLSSTKPALQYAKQELTEGTRREFRRAVSFLLENNALLSEPATAEVVSSLVRIVSVLQLPVSIFKHHFSGLVHTTSPVLVHTALQVYLHFPEAYSDASERSVLLDRLAYLAIDNQQTLSARLLSLHWLLALVTASGKSVNPPPFLSSLQPAVLDPIAIKTSKLEILAAASPPPVAPSQSQAADVSQSEEQPSQSSETRAGLFSQAGVLGAADFELGSAASLEASVAFRTLHRFLISQSAPLLGQDPVWQSDNASSVSTSESSPPNPARRTNGTILQQISAHLVTIAAEHPPQTPNILSLLERLLQSRTHSECGKYLLQTLETSLLPQLKPSKTLPAYFPLFQEMVAHGRGDPKPLLNLLAAYCSKWAESEASIAGFEIGFGSQAWLRGSQVLGVCRSVMLVHPRGKIVEPLKELLDGVMDAYPDIEVRDSAR
jgi:AP-5 complex subunit beta-1